MTGTDQRPNTLVVIVTTVLSVSLLAGCALGLPRTGILLYADPEVTVERPGQGKIANTPGMEVYAGDSIDTAGGQAVIDYDDGSTVMLNRATRVQLGSITLFVGELFARIKSILKEGGGQVVTNEVSASVEGTEYGVRRIGGYQTAAPGAVTVYVRQGRVLCAPGVSGAWLPVALTENLALSATGNRAPPAPQRVDARVLSRWADEAEQRLWKPRPAPVGFSINLWPGPGPQTDSGSVGKPQYEPAGGTSTRPPAAVGR